MIGDILAKVARKQDLTQDELNQLTAWGNAVKNSPQLLDTIFKDAEDGVTKLSHITDNAGTLRAGKFLALSPGIEPTDSDATGAFVSSSGETFGDVLAYIGSVLNGALQAGFTSEGGILGMSGAWRLTADGQLMSGLLFPLYFTATNAGNTRQAWLGMYLPQDATVPVFSIVFTGPEGTNLVSNGDAETGDETGWTDADSAWSVSSTSPYLGTYSFKHNSTSEVYPGKLLQNVVVTAADILTLGFASKLETGILSPYIKLVWKDAGAVTISTDVVYGTHGSSWFATAQNFVVPATVTNVDIELHPGDPFNDCYFDDVQLYVQSVSTELQWKDGGLNAVVDGITYDLINTNPQVVIADNAQASISTSGQTTIWSGSIPANTFIAGGDIVKFQSQFVVNTNASGRTLTLRFIVGATTVSRALSLSANQETYNGTVEGRISRAGSSSQAIYLETRLFNAEAVTDAFFIDIGTASETETAAIAASFTAQLSGSVDSGVYDGAEVWVVRDVNLW